MTDRLLGNLRHLLLSHMESTDDPLLKGAVASPMHNRTWDWLRAEDLKVKHHC